MVDFSNIHTTTSHQINSLHIGEERESNSVIHHTKELFDQMIGQISPYLLNPPIYEENEGNFNLSFRVKGFEETFSYSSSDISSSSELAIAFNTDIAQATLTRLFKEKGGELTVTSLSEVMHVKSQVAVKLPIKTYIREGVFDLEPFIEKALAGLLKKNQTVAKWNEGYCLPISLRAKYPSHLNLLYWLDDVVYLRSSEHPDLLSMADVLRRNYMEGHR